MTNLCGLVALSGMLIAALPVEYYHQAVRESKLKAVAKIVRIEKLGETDWSITRDVTFRLESSLDGTIVEPTFHGVCSSVKLGKIPPPGGTLYFYPREGERVLVAISKAGGAITVMEFLAPEATLAQADTLLRNLSGRGEIDLLPSGPGNIPRLVPLPERPVPEEEKDKPESADRPQESGSQDQEPPVQTEKPTPQPSP